MRLGEPFGEILLEALLPRSEGDLTLRTGLGLLE